LVCTVCSAGSWVARLAPVVAKVETEPTQDLMTALGGEPRGREGGLKAAALSKVPSVYARRICLSPSMPTKKCPVCGVSVKVENLERHVRDQHPHADVDREHVLTEDERRTLEKAQAAGTAILTRGGRRLILISAILLAVVLVLVIANPFRGVGPAVGQFAPDFTVVTSDGNSLRLSSLRGTPVLLEFMDPDCPACQQEAPTLVSLYANYTGSVRFVSIDVDSVGASDTDARINAFRSSYGASWSYALDTTHRVRSAYAVSSTPTTYVLDTAGIVVGVVHPSDNTYAGYAVLLDRALG